MSRHGFTIFLIVVLGIYLLMNWYVLGRFATLLGIKKGLLFWAVVLFMTSSLVISVSAESVLGGLAARIVFNTGAMWLGICFMLVWIHLLFQAIGYFTPVPPKMTAAAVAMIGAIVAIYANINARTVHINTVSVQAPVDMKIVQLSDIHVGSTGPAFLRKVINSTNAQNPDVVLITGDLFDNHNPEAYKAALMLNDIKAPVFFSSGNHEGYVGYGNVRQMLAPTKVRWLENQSAEFRGVEIIGVNNNFEPDQVITALHFIVRKPEYTILMYHQPVGVEEVADAGVNLMLCGHTHGGQIWPFGLLVHGAYEYIAGRFQVRNTTIYVNSGTGTWGPRMRLGTKSEITVLELKKP